MKFHNGCWLLKEGYQSFSPQQAYEVKKQEYELRILAPTRYIHKKGGYPGWGEFNHPNYSAYAGNDPGAGSAPQRRQEKRTQFSFKPESATP